MNATNVMAAVNSIIHGISGSTEVYGAWYEGEEQYNTYMLQAGLTWREKQQAIYAIEMKRREADFLKLQAKEADIETGFVKKIGQIKLEEQQRQTDRGAAKVYARMAKSGVSMSSASPETLMNEIANEGARSYALTKFESDVDTWQAERRARGIKEAAAISLSEAEVMKQQLPMYDYQAMLFSRAAWESRRAAQWRSYGIALGHIGQALGGFSAE